MYKYAKHIMHEIHTLSVNIFDRPPVVQWLECRLSNRQMKRCQRVRSSRWTTRRMQQNGVGVRFFVFFIFRQVIFNKLELNSLHFQQCFYICLQCLHLKKSMYKYAKHIMHEIHTLSVNIFDRPPVVQWLECRLSNRQMKRCQRVRSSRWTTRRMQQNGVGVRFFVFFIFRQVIFNKLELNSLHFYHPSSFEPG